MVQPMDPSVIDQMEYIIPALKYTLLALMLGRLWKSPQRHL